MDALEEMSEQLLTLLQLSLYYLIITRIYLRSKETFRRWRSKPHITEEVRNKVGAYSNLFRYFYLHNHEEFFKLTRMTIEQFDALHEMVKPHLEKPYVQGRKPLSSELKLAATLHFLAHGSSIQDCAWLYRIGVSTMYKLIPEVAEAVIKGLSKKYMPFPNAKQWETIANNMYYNWQMPNCLGAVDGRHFKIKAPPHSGSFFHNYKKHFSFIFMGACDAFHRFTFVKVGDYGHLNDAGVFNNSELGLALEFNLVDLPKAKCLPETETELPYFFVGDSGFGLKSYLMTPFAQSNNMPIAEKIFNYRLSRARRIIECAFGILVKKWRILEYPLNFKLQTTENIALALTCIHNFLISSELSLDESQRRYTAMNEDINEENNEDPVNVQDPNGTIIRNKLAEYFMSDEGSIYFQWLKI